MMQLLSTFRARYLAWCAPSYTWFQRSSQPNLNRQYISDTGWYTPSADQSMAGRHLQPCTQTHLQHVSSSVPYILSLLVCRLAQPALPGAGAPLPL